MALFSKVGNLLKQSGNKNVSMGLSSTNSLLFQTIRSMSSAKLFVGGLSYGTDEMGLREAFQQYGEVIEAKVITDRDSGRSRGFGFVSYTSTDSASSALQDMDGKELHGRRIRVNFAEEKPRPSFRGSGGYGGVGGGGGGYRGAAGGYGGGYAGGAGAYGGAGAEDLFSGGLGSATGASTGGNGDDDGGSFNQDLEGKYGEDDFEEDDYANTSKK
uniref:glycine-rich RNA-binding protein 4, mitochondrial-like n=1 Tax=Erigeron canadensis TaxID=72917 RepID=UPI001CB8D288|nr:glycine-rich RNA-binding protein 4, mitochondrial-like [Erigeron canadensis]